MLTLVHGEALRQFGTLSTEVGITTSKKLKSIILGSVVCFFPVYVMSKQKCAMCRGMRNQCGSKVIHYDACMIDINKYLAVFPGSKESGGFFEAELNEMFLNRITNRWNWQAYVQGVLLWINIFS